MSDEGRTLRAELLAMQARDLATRAALVESGELFDEGYHPRMRAVHEAHNRRMQALIEAHGWPRQSEVGEDGAEAAWLIVQHAVLAAGFQRACVPLLRAAVEAGEAPGWCLAYLEDRVRVGQGLPQRHGTQHETVDGVVRPLPVEDAATLNARRAALGMRSQQAHTAALQAEHDAAQAGRAGDQNR